MFETKIPTRQTANDVLIVNDPSSKSNSYDIPWHISPPAIPIYNLSRKKNYWNPMLFNKKL